MDILIIGNGFDLAHGLKTSYKDFLEYCSSISIQDITDGEPAYKEICKNNLWLKHFITKQKELGDTWIDLENGIYKVIKYINNTAEMAHNAGLSKALPKVLKVSKKNMQFDFFNITELLEHPNETPAVNEKEYAIIEEKGVIQNKLLVYIKTPKGYVNFLYDQLRDFTKIFESYLIENANLKSSPYMLNISPMSSPQSLVQS